MQFPIHSSSWFWILPLHKHIHNILTSKHQDRLWQRDKNLFQAQQLLLSLKSFLHYTDPMAKKQKWILFREACRRKTAKFMTICQRVGRWQTQNMISFLKEIMTRGLVPESLVRKLKPWKIHFLLKNTKLGR